MMMMMIDEVADRVEDAESCRLLWQRAGRQHRRTYWRRSALLTAVVTKRSSAEANPHHVGEAYSSLLATIA